MAETSLPPATIDDLLNVKELDDIQLSPDGTLALFTVTTRGGERDRPAPAAIMAVPTNGDAPWQFSAGTSVDSQPRWSPDGREVAFLSDRPHGLPTESRPGATQVYLQRRAGGEARRVSAVDGEIQHLSWSPDGAHLTALIRDPEPVADPARGEAIDIEATPRFCRLWSLDPAGQTARVLTPPDLQIWGYDITSAGDSALGLVSDLPDESSWYRARLAMVGLAGESGPGEVRTIHATRRQLAQPNLSPDGTTATVLSCTWSDRGLHCGDLLLVDIVAGTTRNLTEGRPTSVSWAEWEADGRSLLACGFEQGEIAFWRIGVDGSFQPLWRAPGMLRARHQPRFSRAGGLVGVLRHDAEHPTDLWVTKVNEQGLGHWRQVTRMNPRVSAWAQPTCTSVTWQAADGMSIQGWLVRPPLGADDAAPVPLVVMVHGGPAWLYTSATVWHEWVGLHTARGIAVFLPNPRGSLGWGTAFAEANHGDMGGADFADIMAGVDYLIGQGIADPDRLAIGGWSYGGFMTAWAVTQTNRFKAAMMGAGICDWRSFHGLSSLHVWDALFYGTDGKDADPYDPEGPYARFSPITYIDRVHTPTLILHGERDLDVPVGQGLQFYRALHDRGVPVSMTMYPRAGHGPSERAQIQDVAQRFVDWTARYLLGND
jgi:dipeptidyl aminopeptidase/acylaminoacyl peptidase